MGLFDRVFRGSDEMFAKAEAEINAVVAELGESAPMKMPDTAYYLSCIYAYLGKKVTTLGELRDTLADVKAMMTREYKTKDIFTSGVGTAIAAEMIEACKYARNPDPYAGTNYHGHFTDAEVRTLGVPLVTRDIPGFVVMIGPAPTKEEALETVKGYQSRGIFVFLIGGIIDQLIECGMTMNFDVRVVPVGEDIWSVGHIISLVVRAAFIFGAVQPGDYDGHIDYSFHRIFAFVNAYAPVPDITVACGAGAIQLGFPVITNDTDDMWAVPKSLIINENTQDWIETSLEARDIKIKVTNIDIPVAFSNAFEGEIIRKNDTQIEIDGSRVDCCEFCRTEEAQNIEDHAIILDGPDFDEFEPGSKICLTITLEVAGKSWQTDFEPVVERKFHNFLNCIEGVMHTGQRDMIRVRVSKAAFEAMGEADFSRAPVTTGPYKVAEWIPGTSITLTRNEYYWGEPAKTENIVIKFIPEATSRVIELETGAADIAYYIEGNDVARVDALDGYHVESGDAYRYLVVTFSMQDAILKDARVRQALCYAIDQELLVEASSDGLGTAITGFCSTPAAGYKALDPWPYDVEKAKSLLAEAGYADGFTIDLHVEPISLYEKAAEIIQSMWAEVGVTANIVSSALATYDAQHNGQFQACIRDSTASEISNMLIIYESSFGSRIQGNDDWLDGKLLELRTYYYDDPQRTTCLDEIYTYLNEQRYSYPYMNMPINYAVSDKLEGFEFHPAIDHMKHITDWVVYE